MFKNIGSDIVSGASTKTDTLGRNLIKGIREELADPETKKQVAHFADSIITALNNSLSPKVNGLVDTVINHKVLLWADSLVETLTGKKLQLNMKNLQYTLVGKSKTDVLQIRNSFQKLFEQILSDSTNSKLGKMRDELLGAKTDSAISLIVDNATKKFIDRYKSDLNPVLKGDVSFVSQHATALLITLGSIAVVIILVIWWSRSRYQRMVTLLTKHINKIPDQQIYDKVTSNIKDEAISTGLEPGLRKILRDNGLLGNENWKSKNHA
jgi:DNA-binding ferritin-like protein (Dps family)